MFNNTTILPDEVLSMLNFTAVDPSALAGFFITRVEYGIGPDGVALLLGHYSNSETQEYVFQIYMDNLDNSSGVVYQRAELGGDNPT